MCALPEVSGQEVGGAVTPRGPSDHSGNTVGRSHMTSVHVT